KNQTKRNRQRITAAPAPETFAQAQRPSLNWAACEEAIEIFGQLRGTAIAVMRRLFETFQANRFEVARNRRIASRRTQRCLGDHLPLGFGGGFAAERRVPRE